MQTLLIITLIFLIAVALIITYAKTPIDNIYELCESGLERKLLDGMLEHLDNLNYFDGTFSGRFDGHRYTIRLQAEGLIPNRKFRPDFLITRHGLIFSKTVIIEADGEIYHDKERDAHRDALFLKHGYRTLRFPSKEINKQPFDCGRRALFFCTRSGKPSR